MTEKQTRDLQRTKANILRAAQDIFSTKGYSEAGIRDIAKRAGSNPSLVNRYFGSKEQLFEEALAETLDNSYLNEISHSEFGKEVVGMFLRPDKDNVNPLPMLVFSIAHARTREIAINLLKDRIIDPLAIWFDSADGQDRAARFMAITAGFFTYRDLLPLDSFSGEMSPENRKWLEDELQSLVDK